MHHYATFLSLEFPQSYLLECVGIEPARIEHVKPGAKRSDGPVKVLTWLTKSSTVLIEEAHGNLQMEAVEFHSVHKTERKSVRFHSQRHATNLSLLHPVLLLYRTHLTQSFFIWFVLIRRYLL